MPKIGKNREVEKEELKRLLFEKASQIVKLTKEITKLTGNKSKLVTTVFSEAKELGVKEPGDKIIVNVPESENEYEIAYSKVSPKLADNALSLLISEYGEEEIEPYIIKEPVLAPNAVESLILNGVVDKEWAKEYLFTYAKPKRIVKQVK